MMRPTSITGGTVQKACPRGGGEFVQQGRNPFGARSVLPVREHSKRARRPLAAFSNSPKGGTVLVRHVVFILMLMVTIIGGHAHSLRAQQTPSRDSPQQIMIRVDGASCPFCAFGLEKRLGRIEGVADVKLEMKAGKVIVTLEKGATVSEQALRQAVDEAGFTPREITFPQSG